MHVRKPHARSLDPASQRRVARACRGGWRPAHQRGTGSQSHGRQATIVPLLVVSMITMLLVGAWVIDRSWVSSACGELVLATEAAAHAAAVELVDDSRLTGHGEELRLRRARYAASRLASANRVVGRPVHVDEADDILFGRALAEPLSDDEIDPRVVAVRGARTATNGDPIGLLLSAIGGTGYTDLSHTAVVELNNRLLGIAASEDRPAPVLPIAIRRVGTDGVAGWDDAIVEETGTDLYHHDRTENSIQHAPDGLTEIVLTFGEDADSNAQVVSSEGFGEATVERLFERGFTATDIALSDLSPLETNPIGGEKCRDLIERFDLVGRERILFLMDDTIVTGLVAGRIMAVEHDQNGRVQVVVQPCVMTLAQAITANTLPNGNTSETDFEPNPYLFKLTTVH